MKNTGPRAHKVLYQIIKTIWQEKSSIPEDWTMGMINPVPKKGDLTRCQNCRPITLLSTAYKVTTSIIRGKLEEFYENVMGEYQSGFRKNKPITNQLFTLRHALEKL